MKVSRRMVVRNPAQRRPGREPRRQRRQRLPAVLDAQRRPGREPRRHARQADRAALDEEALNEGRGVNPGDTRRPTGSRCSPRRKTAQRRPGREPRRHTRPTPSPGIAATPAQRRPGREPRRHNGPRPTRSSRVSTLNRRPGREPRRHLGGVDGGTGRRPAQRRPGREPRRHVLRTLHPDRPRGRSTKAGA